jgi:RHS repeat-associated protein
MLSGVTTPTTTATYTYNGDDQRVAVTQDGTTTAFVLDQAVTDETVLQETTAGTTTSYVYGGDLISRQSGSSIVYYLTDALGSVRLVTDASGAVVGSYTYDAFGNVLTDTDSSGNKFAFTGQWSDVDGLTFLRARYYDPQTGRFLSVDPEAASDSDPQTLNPYVYCQDNPIVAIDPSGRSFLGSLAKTVKRDFAQVESPVGAVWNLINPVVSAANSIIGNVTGVIEVAQLSYALGEAPAKAMLGNWTGAQQTLEHALLGAVPVYGAMEYVSTLPGGAPVSLGVSDSQGSVLRTLQQNYQNSASSGNSITYGHGSPPVFHPYTYGRPYMPLSTK